MSSTEDKAKQLTEALVDDRHGAGEKAGAGMGSGVARFGAEMYESLREDVHDVAEFAEKQLHSQEKEDFGLFYKSQYHHMQSMSQDDLDEIKKKAREIKKDKDAKPHISEVFALLKRKNYESDQSIYNDIKSRSKLQNIVLDPRIKPTVFAKKVAEEIKKHQQIQEADIIPLNRNCHSLSELFSENYDVEGGFLANKADPPQVRELRGLKGVEPASISVEYLSWKDKYYMMLKYAIKNEDGQIEQHLKILNFNHNFNSLVYAAKTSKKRESERKESKKGQTNNPSGSGKPEDEAEDAQRKEEEQKTKMGQVIFATKLHTYSGKREGDEGQEHQGGLPLSGMAQAHNNLTLKYGQWIFFYTIHTDYDAGTETVKLCSVNLDAKKARPSSTEAKQDSQIAPAQPAEKDNRYQGSLPPGNYKEEEQTLFEDAQSRTISVIALPKSQKKDDDNKGKAELFKRAMSQKLKSQGIKGQVEEAEATENNKEEDKQEFEDLEIVTTDCIVFNSDSKFLGDRTIVGEFSHEEATKWLSKQYVVQIGQTQNQKLVLSIRRAGDLSKSIIAVQSKDNETTKNKPNDVTLAYHRSIQLRPEEEESDYLGLSVNQSASDLEDAPKNMHIFKINRPQTEAAEDAETEEKTKTATQESKEGEQNAQSTASAQVAQGNQEGDAADVDEDKDKEEGAPEEKNQDQQEPKEAIAASAQQEEATAAAATSAAPVAAEDDEEADEDQTYPKPELENIILNATKDAEAIKLVSNLLRKAKSSKYCIYDFRKNYNRTYLYKQFLEHELAEMIAEMRIKESKRADARRELQEEWQRQQENQKNEKNPDAVNDQAAEGMVNKDDQDKLQEIYEKANQYEILGHNIIFMEFDSVNQERNYTPIRNFRYVFQIIGQSYRGIEIMFFSTGVEKNQRYRVIEEFNPKFESPMVRAIAANGGGEIRQMHSGYNNVFLAGNGRSAAEEEEEEERTGKKRPHAYLILGDECLDDLDFEGARMQMTRELWKQGSRCKYGWDEEEDGQDERKYIQVFEKDRKEHQAAINNWLGIRKGGVRTSYQAMLDAKPSVLGLECFDHIGKQSNRIHHMHQDRNVTVRMHRYHEKGPKEQQMIELEVWNTKKYEESCKHHHQLKNRKDYQICREVVQTQFLNLENLKDFGNLCHSSPVQLDGSNYKQRFQVLCRIEASPASGTDDDGIQKHKRYVIYEYELNWNDDEPIDYDPERPGQTTRLKLIGQKTLILNGEDVLREPYLVPYYPSEHSTIISGTQILSAHVDKQKKIRNSISLPNFDSSDFQFKTGIANTGYKIYMDTNDDQDWKCLLVESQLNTHEILNYEDETEQERRENARTGLTNEDLRRLYDQQLSVVLNMVPFDQLKTTYRYDLQDASKRKAHEAFDASKQDKLAPLEVLGSNSLCDYLLHQPVRVDACFDNTEEQPSLVEQFIRNQEEIRGDKAATAKGETRKFEQQIDAAFGEGSYWKRGRNEIWQDLLQSNPIMRCYDNEDMSLPSISATKLTKVLNSQGAGIRTYEMLMMLLPTILETDDIDVSEYANFFIDAPDSNNFGMRLEGKVEFKGELKDLPKYSAEELDIQVLPTDGRNVDLDQRHYAKRYLVHNNELESEYANEYERAKREGKLRFGKLAKKAPIPEADAEFMPEEEDEFEYEGGIKNINVKHYLISFQSISYINRIRCIQGIRESDDLDVTEFEMADYMLKINQKFADYCDQAPIIRNIIDEKFEATKRFFLVNLLIYLLFFVTPFLVQIFYIHETKNWLVVWICVIMCQATQAGFLFLEYQQIMQDGFANYIQDFDNKNDLMTCLSFPIYTFMRLNYTNNMLPTATGEVNLIYAYFLFSNCIFTLNIAFKVFKFMKTNSKFGLLVQLVSTAVRDCINFTIFMFIWIAVFSLLYRILGSYNSNQAQNFPNIDDVTTFFLQTFENALGNISSPTYNLWSVKLKCAEERHTHPHDPKCTHANVGVITDQTYWISQLSIYLIWLVWFANQFLILIILLNFLISVISKSYSDVMDSALMFKYVQMCELNREFAILNEQLFSTDQIKSLILTANNDDDDGNADFGGLVSQIKDYIKGENRSLNKFIREQRTEVEKHVTIKNKSIEDNLGSSKQEIKERISELNSEMQENIRKVQANVNEMQVQLDGSVRKRRQEMNVDITDMHKDMKDFFGKIRETMQADMETFKDEISAVKKGVTLAKEALNEDLKNVETGVKAGIDGVHQRVAEVDSSVNVVSTKVADVHQGVNAVKDDTLAEFSKVKNSVGDVSNNLKSVESGVNSKISGVQASVQAVDSSVSKVQQGVSDVNKDLKEVDAKANAQDEVVQQQAKAKEDIEKLQQVQAELEEQLADEKEKHAEQQLHHETELEELKKQQAQEREELNKRIAALKKQLGTDDDGH